MSTEPLKRRNFIKTAVAVVLGLLCPWKKAKAGHPPYECLYRKVDDHIVPQLPPGCYPKITIHRWVDGRHVEVGELTGPVAAAWKEQAHETP